MVFPSHAWVKRYLFPDGKDSITNDYILHFENKQDIEELIVKFTELLLALSKEVGLLTTNPKQLEIGRFIIEGPKGFSVIEVSPAYTQEEFDKINVGDSKLDETVWGSLFGTKELPEENERISEEESSQ